MANLTPMQKLHAELESVQRKIDARREAQRDKFFDACVEAGLVDMELKERELKEAMKFLADRFRDESKPWKRRPDNDRAPGSDQSPQGAA